MPQKRKRTETAAASAAPIYASEVEWLRGLVHRDTSYYDAINADDTNTKLIVEACKLTYILHHDIEAHDCLSLLLQSLNKGDGCDSANDVMKEARLKQSSWKGHILNKFFLPHVKELKRRWEIAHPYASFASLSDKEHTRTWMEPYDSDPESIASKMLKPVIMVLDLNNIFAVVPMTEDAKKMHAVRIMLRQKYWYGCYCTYKHSVAVDEKNQTLEDWARYTEFKPIMPSIVSIADMPISRSFARMEVSSKRIKTSVVSEATLERRTKDAKNTTPSRPSNNAIWPLSDHEDERKSGQIPEYVNPFIGLELYEVMAKRSVIGNTTSSPSPLGAPVFSPAEKMPPTREKVLGDQTTSYFDPAVSTEAESFSIQTIKVEDDLL